MNDKKEYFVIEPDRFILGSNHEVKNYTKEELEIELTLVVQKVVGPTEFLDSIPNDHISLWKGKRLIIKGEIVVPEIEYRLKDQVAVKIAEAIEEQCERCNRVFINEYDQYLLPVNNSGETASGPADTAKAEFLCQSCFMAAGGHKFIHRQIKEAQK